MMQQIILASASPRRAEILKQIGLSFKIMASDLDENLSEQSFSPPELVMDLALKKARQVAPVVNEGLIIGADTVVVINDEILGKPAGSAEAAMMLAKLNGKVHSVFTGIALVEIPGGKNLVGCAETKVKFRTLNTAEINAYVATGESLDKAGAYGIQGKGAVLVETITGCYFNIVGLPIAKLLEMLREFGVVIW